MTKTVAVITAVIVTALLVGSAAFFIGSSRDGDDGLQERVDTLQEENEALQARQSELEEEVTALKAENQELREQLETPLQISRELPDGWETYFPTAETTTLVNESTGSVRALFGEPPYLIRSIAVVPGASRQIWIYTPTAEDPTGLYIYFKGDQVHSSRLDEFNGLYGSGLLDNEDFWLR